MTIDLSNNKLFFRVWLCFHLALTLLLLGSAFVRGGLFFDADFMNMLPESSVNQALRAADRALSKTSSENVFILVGSEDFEVAKRAAEDIFAKLDGKAAFNSVTMSADVANMGDVKDFVQKWRWNFIPKDAQDEISFDSLGFCENALSSAFGFSLLGLENIDSDPFMLSERVAKGYLAAISDSGVAMSSKDGVLAREFEGVWYVMIRATLSKEGAKLLSKTNAVPLIYESCKEAEKNGVKCVFYGTPFHSYKSSTASQAEITRISVVCSLLVLALLLAVFRSGVPIVFSMLSVAISLFSALSATQIVFGKIHSLTLVFGTTLIGSSIDYSLHYFMAWKSAKGITSTADIRKKLFKGATLSLFSTLICYALLVFAPFALVKQMAVFSFAGIASTYLTSLCLFPLLPLPSEKKRGFPFLEKQILPKVPKIASRIVLLSLFLLSVALIFVKRDSVKIKNNISSLYKMEGKLKDDTILAYKILEYSPASYLIVSGDSAEEVLEKEEAFSEKLAAKGIRDYLCTTKFVPSAKRQSSSLDCAERLLENLDEQMDFLGFDKEDADKVREDFASAKKMRFNIEENNAISSLPSALQSVLGSLWLGKSGEKYYSLIVPSKITDSSLYEELADGDEGVFFDNKVDSISKGLDKLTLFICKIFALAYIVIFALVRRAYSWKKTLKIAFIPLFSVAAVVAVFAVCGMAIEFFSVTGLILVFGLGLDYIIYFVQAGGEKEEKVAVFLSFATTALSFGALALSSFVPVHVLGLSILVGLTSAFIATAAG